MSPKNLWSRRPWIAAFIFALVAGLTVFMSGQQRGRMADPSSAMHVPILSHGPQQDSTGLPGLADDWTHHHLVFSDPGTEEDAIGRGAHEQWLSIVNDPRYITQQLKRHAPARGPWAEYVDRMNEMSLAQYAAGGDEFGARQVQDSDRLAKGTRPSRRPPVIRSDWQMDLGGGKVGADQFPAKFSFSTTAVGRCSNQSPADYVVYNTGVAGVSTSQANIIAYDNIYSGCPSAGGSSTVPLVYWSYYTGTGTAATSVVIDFNGDKVAFIESNTTADTSILRIVKWKAGEGTDYKSPGVPNATYTYANTYAGASGNKAWNTTNCPSGNSCMISVAFQADNHSDTTSPPWYDYASDTIYVGDSAGYLHQFTGVFNGTPGESTTASGGTCGTSCKWPVEATTSAHALTGPVFDNSHSLIFLGVGAGTGQLVSVSSSTEAVETSSVLSSGSADIVSIADAPLVDPSAGTAGEVYTFIEAIPSTHYNAVIQFAEGSISGAGGTSETFGSGSSTTAPFYSGSFDNTYFTSASASSPSGHLWVCANNSSNNPYLYAITIASNSMTAVTTGVELSGASTPCSPVSEFYGASGTFTISALTQSGTTVTVTAAGNGFESGQSVTIAGVTSGTGCSSTLVGGINGQRTITVVTSGTSFTFTSADSGTITSGCGLSGATAAGATDYIFVSPESQSTTALQSCTASEGCVISYANGGTTATLKGAGPFPGGSSGMVVDTQNTTVSGTLQLYFGILGSVACTGNGSVGSGTGGCAIQAPLTAP